MIYQSLPSEKRQELGRLDLGLTIDTGFVHRRRIQTIIGDVGMRIVDEETQRLPELPSHEVERRTDHIYTKVMLAYCNVHNVPTLEQCLTDFKSAIFCGNVLLEPCHNFYEVDRAISQMKSPVEPEVEPEVNVEFHYTTGRVKASTLRDRLHEGSLVSMVGVLHESTDSKRRFDPIIMGFPWVTTDNPKWAAFAPWAGLAAYEVFIEDFDEFAAVAKHRIPKDHGPMEMVSEASLKAVLAQHLRDPIQRDWGGEQSDHFSANLHLNGKRITGAFLLKGPSHYRQMKVSDLGKNGNQIIRLAHEPADVLIVQHCHDISQDVRTMLQLVAAQPGNPRRYCCVDGRETLRVLRALGLYDSAASKGKA